MSVNVIGVGGKGIASLSDEKLLMILKSDIIIGWGRHLEDFKNIPVKKILLKSDLSELGSLLEIYKNKMITILSSGDPNFFGIAGYLYGVMDKKDINVYPGVSSMQLAFAAIKETMNDAQVLSLHGRDSSKLRNFIVNYDKIGIYTDKLNTPSFIGEKLLDWGEDQFSAYVCQNLDMENESVKKMSVKALQNYKVVSDLNIVILIREKEKKEIFPFGIPDDQFFVKNNMITKEEIRVITLSKLRLSGDSIFWDVGAGSGSISIEASVIIKTGWVYAVEKSSKAALVIRKNIKKFVRKNISLIQGEAPQCLEGLPIPNAIFIGGNSGRIREIVSYAITILPSGGRLVFNTVIINHLHDGIQAIKEQGLLPETVMVNLAKEKNLPDVNYLKANNPVFIVSVRK